MTYQYVDYVKLIEWARLTFVTGLIMWMFAGVWIFQPERNYREKSNWQLLQGRLNRWNRARLYGGNHYRTSEDVVMTDQAPTATAAQYKAMMMLAILPYLAEGVDPANDFSIAELEDLLLSSNQTLPLVRLPEHYLRGSKYFTNRGYVELCNCSAEWPCPIANDLHTAPTAPEMNMSKPDAANDN